MTTLHRSLQVSIDDQTLSVFEGNECLHCFQVSTAAKGMGFTRDSYRTPTGRFRIVEKIGEGETSGTIFKQRVAAGYWSPEMLIDGDLVLSRVLRIEGLEPENANTFERFIYIHGTNHQDRIGSPASQGCIRLRNSDMIDLFSCVDVGTEMCILPATKRRGKLFFVDCDSTLSAIEGIDELARAQGEEIFAKAVALTNAAMNGELPIHEIFPRRMEMIRPNQALCHEIAQLYQATVVPGFAEMIQELKKAGWTPVILSGGFAPLIQPLARQLGISYVEAVPLYFNEDGSYQGFGEDYPTTRNLGKNEIIREWQCAMLPERCVMMGDGVSDLETKPDVDLFIGFGGVVVRPKVQMGCDYWVTDLSEHSELMARISAECEQFVKI